MADKRILASLCGVCSDAPYYSVQFSVLTIQVEAEGEQRGAHSQHHQQRQHRAAAAGKQRVNTLNRLNN